MVLQILNTIIDYFMDSLEEFVKAIKFPTASYTKQAFFVSLIITVVSMVLDAFGLSTIIQWQEGLTANILLLIVTLIDGSNRSLAKRFANQFRNKAAEAAMNVRARVTNASGYSEEYCEDEDYQQEEQEDAEGYWEDGSYHFYDENVNYEGEDNNGEQ